MSRIDLLKDGPVKTWYRKHMNPVVFDIMVDEAIDNGYVLIPDTGLLFRGLSYGNIVRLGNTNMDIIFPRPVDFHYHEDVDEALKVLNGEGVLYIYDSEQPISKGKEIYIPKREKHSFRPNENEFLEIKLGCSGILDTKKEICVKRFDEFEPWKKYYEQFRKKK